MLEIPIIYFELENHYDGVKIFVFRLVAMLGSTWEF